MPIKFIIDPARGCFLEEKKEISYHIWLEISTSGMVHLRCKDEKGNCYTILSLLSSGHFIRYALPCDLLFELESHGIIKEWKQCQ